MTRLPRIALLLVLVALPPGIAWVVPPQALARLGIDVAPKERVGIEYVRGLGELLHRLARYQVLGGGSGNPDALSRDALRSAQLQIAASIEAVDQLDRRLGGFLTTAPKWGSLKTQWHEARGRRPGPEARALLDAAESVLAAVGQAFNLTGDASFDNYRMLQATTPKVRLINEHLAEANAAGTSTLSRKLMSADEKTRLARLSESIKSVLNMLDQTTQAAFRDDLDLKSQIGPAVQDCFISGHLFLDIIDSKLLKGQLKDVDTEEWMQSAQHAIDASTRLEEVLSTTADALLQRRIDDFSKKEYLRTTLALTPTLLVPLVMLFFYRMARGVLAGVRGSVRPEVPIKARIPVVTRAPARVVPPAVDSVVSAEQSADGSPEQVRAKRQDTVALAAPIATGKPGASGAEESAPEATDTPSDAAAEQAKVTRLQLKA